MLEFLYPTQAVADILGVRVQAVQRWVRSGKLKAFRIGRGRRARLRIPESGIRALMGMEPENQTTEARSLPVNTVISEESSGSEKLEQARKLLKDLAKGHLGR